MQVNGSGRTDAGVHAEGQVASFSMEWRLSPEKLRAAINGNMEPDVRAVSVEVASDEFHARYSARSKTYVYRIVNGPVMSPFWRRYALHESRKIKIDKVISAARLFAGTHDWTAFSAAQSDVESRVRTIKDIDVTQRVDLPGGYRMIELWATSEGFLRYMVRSIAGALLAVGLSQLSEGDILDAIKTGLRSPFIVTAPAHGLTLVRVHY